MKNNRMMNCINFLGFLKSNRDVLFQEFKKKEELQRLMQPEKVNTVFQPILSLEKGRTIGFEILNRPQTTPLFSTTEKFYDYVGKSRDVFLVEHFLRNLSLERYSEQIKSSQSHKDKLVFLNIQPQVLADPAYQSGKTLELLAKHNLSPNQIVLELTEKEAVIDYRQFEGMIEHYRHQGFRIAVDDAGTGYNSLKTLVYLKPEFIKLDKSLIRNISEHPAQQHLVELLLKFAQQSETLIIAEGIETLSELRFLQKLGVHMGQGFGLGKPKPTLINGSLPISNPHIYKEFA
ncbi:EAL domain-containing protein [Bacillus sp. V3-13]|uniref:EAL domain-containing protein n=1 Tax=Bacillus sp. V3-13 TaxID=2053728 RepID=UPI000C758B40|nr:EAL domain-containing protein [Bacillus sp. V3-13]PLR76229.1 EAL domain-containing protein [Bacillus sp. V3-13]